MSDSQPRSWLFKKISSFFEKARESATEGSAALQNTILPSKRTLPTYDSPNSLKKIKAIPKEDHFPTSGRKNLEFELKNLKTPTKKPKNPVEFSSQTYKLSPSGKTIAFPSSFSAMVFENKNDLISNDELVELQYIDRSDSGFNSVQSFNQDSPINNLELINSEHLSYLPNSSHADIEQISPSKEKSLEINENDNKQNDHEIYLEKSRSKKHSRKSKSSKARDNLKKTNKKRKMALLGSQGQSNLSRAFIYPSERKKIAGLEKDIKSLKRMVTSLYNLNHSNAVENSPISKDSSDGKNSLDKVPGSISKNKGLLHTPVEISRAFSEDVESRVIGPKHHYPQELGNANINTQTIKIKPNRSFLTPNSTYLSPKRNKLFRSQTTNPSYENLEDLENAQENRFSFPKISKDMIVYAKSRLKPPSINSNHSKELDSFSEKHTGFSPNMKSIIPQIINEIKQRKIKNILKPRSMQITPKD
ncbi:hypothetical protein BB560_000445 [Smittium megazygosporum]|uniref:Uncharacterized protein n=1 Tax=Smittium megazygosporum TaxID=133381 RepID=A0A2T9ZKB5_9FUNG|nr:hypothetical protein BB560_000445 [Smittium megazygosporum]